METQSLGPYSVGVLRASWREGGLSVNDLIWNGDTNDWLPAAEYFKEKAPAKSTSNFWRNFFRGIRPARAAIWTGLLLVLALTFLIFENLPAGEVLSWLAYLPASFALLAIYFLPSLVARHRKHRNLTAIRALNLLLGWTLVGWVVALVWASQAQETDKKA